MILLSDEEIALAIDKANGGKEWREGWELQEVIEEQDRFIAKAQLKKVLEEAKTEDLSWKFRQALLKEIE